MCDTPKVGETWMRRSRAGDREAKILEEVVCKTGGVLYLVSYYSKAMCRRACETVGANDLYPKPVKLVNYQLMTVTEEGSVKSHASVHSIECLYQYYWVDVTDSRYIKRTRYIQRTEVTGDKIEVFFEEMLP